MVTNFLTLFWETELLGKLSFRPQANHSSHKYGWMDKFGNLGMLPERLEAGQRAFTQGIDIFVHYDMF
jgi:hypothetical protein